jgi:hypothetical protein
MSNNNNSICEIDILESDEEDKDSSSDYEHKEISIIKSRKVGRASSKPKSGKSISKNKMRANALMKHAQLLKHNNQSIDIILSTPQTNKQLTESISEVTTMLTDINNNVRRRLGKITTSLFFFNF